MPKRKKTSVAHNGPLRRSKRTAVAPGVHLISALPDELLHHVLGLLQAREAVRTCVLARRWRNLWKHMTILRVSGAGPIKLHRKFVKQLLLHRGHSNLEVCLFHFDRHDTSDWRYVNQWMRHALLRKVGVLSVTVLGHGGMVKELGMDNRPLVSRYLTKLKLSGLILRYKFLDFSRCEALKCLKMADCRIHADKISSRTLEHLSIRVCMFLSDQRARISAPSLSSLEVHRNWGKTAFLEDMPLLETATIHSDLRCHDSCQNYILGNCNDVSCWECCRTDDASTSCVLLKGLSAARNLKLTAAREVVPFLL